MKWKNTENRSVQTEKIHETEFAIATAMIGVSNESLWSRYS